MCKIKICWETCNLLLNNKGNINYLGNLLRKNYDSLDKFYDKYEDKIEHYLKGLNKEILHHNDEIVHSMISY